MGLFAVTYQLNKDKDYPALWEIMKDFDAHKVMRDLYYLDLPGTESAESLKDQLVKLVDGDDQIAVIQMHVRPAHQRPNKGTGDWLRDHM